MFARDGVEGLSVLLNQLIFKVIVCDHYIAWNDEIAFRSADRTGPVVGLLYFLVVGGSPVSDAIKTERMRTILQQSKSSSVRQHFLKANDALLVSLVLQVSMLIRERLRCLFSLQRFWMQILTVITVPAVATLVELTYLDHIVILKEIVNDLVVRFDFLVFEAAAAVRVHHLIHAKVNSVVCKMIHSLHVS